MFHICNVHGGAALQSRCRLGSIWSLARCGTGFSSPTLLMLRGDPRGVENQNRK